GADEEQGGIQQHCRAAAIPVGDRPGDEGADRASEQDRRDGKAGGRRPRAEGAGQRADGSADDTALESEQKGAERGSGADPYDGRGAVRRARDRRRARRQDAAGHVSIDGSYRFIQGHTPSRTLGVGALSQKLIPASNPTTKASRIWPVPPGRMMYWRSGAK